MSSEITCTEEDKDLCIHAFWYTTCYFSIDGNYILECLPQQQYDEGSNRKSDNKKNLSSYPVHGGSGFLLGMGITSFWRFFKFGHRPNHKERSLKYQATSAHARHDFYENSCDTAADCEALKVVSRVIGQLPPPHTWPNRPLYLRTSPLHAEIVARSSHNSQVQVVKEVPVQLHGGPSGFGASAEHLGIPIDTEHFHGRAYLLIADLPDTPKDYFR
jgi:hypothetical protein